MINALAASQLLHPARPIGSGFIVDGFGCAEFADPLQFRVTARGGDDSGACHLRKLQREQGNAPGALDEHGITRLDPAFVKQRIPGRHSGAREGRRFLEGKVFRNQDQAIFGQHDILT